MQYMTIITINVYMYVHVKYVYVSIEHFISNLLLYQLMHKHMKLAS